MDETSVSFTMHAIKRARQRKLWKYVNKKKFFYDAVYYKFNMAILENCIYAFKVIKDKTVIKTMFPKE
jgi:hypothetical protein